MLEEGFSDGRSNWLPAPAAFALSQECFFIQEALQGRCYLVGSSLQAREFRDVDVRVIMDDDKYDSLFGKCRQDHSPFWSLLCTSVSLMLSQRTGLNVDFQVQRRGWISKRDWDKPRNPLSVYYSNARPSWQMDKEPENGPKTEGLPVQDAEGGGGSRYTERTVGRNEAGGRRERERPCEAPSNGDALQVLGEIGAR